LTIKHSSHFYTGVRLALLIISAVFSVLLLVVIVGRGFLLLNVDGAGSENLVGADFSYFYVAGQLVEHSNVAELYDVEAYNSKVADIRNIDAFPRPSPWSYPPTIFPLVASLTLFDFQTAWILWTVFGVVAFAFISRVGTGSWNAASMALLSPFFLLTLMIGQIGIILAVLLIGGLLLYRRGYRVSAGLVWGLLIIKPHLALGLPLLVLRDRQWSTVAGASASISVLVLVSWVVWPDAWGLLFASLGNNVEQVLVAGDERLTKMATFYSLFMYLGVPSGIAMALHAVLAAVAIGLGIRIIANSSSIIHQLSVLVILPAMVSPYLFHNDLVGMAFLVALASAYFGGRHYNGIGSLVFLLLLLLTILIILDTFLFVHLCTPFFLLLLWVINTDKDDSLSINDAHRSEEA